MAMKIDIRRATAQEAAVACALLRRSILQGCARDHRHDRAILERWLANKTPATVASWIASPANHCLLAFADGTVAGVAVLTRKGRIGLLHVDPGLLCLGIGSALLQAIEAQARGWGLASLRVDSPRGAHAFYLRHGYRDGEEIRTVYGVDAVRLVKRVAPAHARRPACHCQAMSEM
jgi:GNAT superfamily N-acetyltransferase